MTRATIRGDDGDQKDIGSAVAVETVTLTGMTKTWAPLVPTREAKTAIGSVCLAASAKSPDVTPPKSLSKSERRSGRVLLTCSQMRT